MSRAEQILEIFFGIRKSGYGKTLPGKYDEMFIELAGHYQSVDESVRQEIRNYVADESRLLLLGFGDRLATIARRKADDQLLFLAILSHSIEDFRYDSRENIFRLALMNHVALKLNIDPNLLFSKAANLSSERAANEFRQFNELEAGLKDLSVMNIKEVQTVDGIDYVYSRQ